jgi:hypothetical protein
MALGKLGLAEEHDDCRVLTVLEKEENKRAFDDHRLHETIFINLCGTK